MPGFQTVFFLSFNGPEKNPRKSCRITGSHGRRGFVESYFFRNMLPCSSESINVSEKLAVSIIRDEE
jgi:hypothetical protein